MADSQESSIPNTLIPDVAGTDEGDHIFAWLRPLSPAACDAFEQTVNAVIEHPEKYSNAQRFLDTDSRFTRAASVPLEESTADKPNQEREAKQWIGAFKFSLETPPQTPEEGWCLGTGDGQESIESVDILLAPPKRRSEANGISGRHAFLAFHPESLQLVLRARHTLTLCGPNGADTFTGPTSRMLGHGATLLFGDCAYVFECSRLFSTPAFVQRLSKFMKTCYGAQWTLKNRLSQASGGGQLTIGKYTCSPGAFAQGTFGQVTAGWAQDGTAVAIKRFKSPQQVAFISHLKIMDHIGEHDNVTRLLDCVSDFSPNIPGAYCVYSPLAVGSLTDVMRLCMIDVHAQTTLIVDFLAGLAFLHGEKGVMHRDINPNNLGIVSFCPPKGVILDLDLATQSASSKDYESGTTSYLAPEVVDIMTSDEYPNRGKPEGYTNKVDIWALGLSLLVMYRSEHLSWRQLARDLPEGKRWRIGTKLLKRAFVEPDTYGALRERMLAEQMFVKDPYAIDLLNLAGRMLTWCPDLRPSATALLSLAKPSLAKNKGTIEPKTGLKRQLEAGS